MIQLWQAATALVGILVLMGLVSIILGLFRHPPAFCKQNSARAAGTRAENQHSQTG